MRDQYDGTAEYGLLQPLVDSGLVLSLLYMASACQMRWTGEVSITFTLDWEKHIRVVKLCMPFESGPEWIETLS